MLRRILKGEPPLKPDGKHIHHRLIKRGFTQKQAVRILYIIAIIACILADLFLIVNRYKTLILILICILFLFYYFFFIRKNKIKVKES